MRTIKRKLIKYNLSKDTSVPYDKWYYTLKNPFNDKETLLLYGFSKEDLIAKINKQRMEWFNEQVESIFV